MSTTNPALASKYEPKTTEAKWQHYWEENQVFKADPNHEGEPYCIVIPPPNVTGSLHMGHAFESALIDTLVRYHRMQGRNTLWLPGTDHASIGVQAILDRQLQAEGKTRYDLGREKFLERAWQWKADSEGRIVNQLRRLGVSADWSRERFTMDEGLSKAVLKAFVQLYEEGLIYRGNYMVNWCPASQSAISDLEVENKEVDGHLWHFRYPLSKGNGYLEVATTRPETMLGDTAVAVNPEDKRYQKLIGKTVKLPIVGREIPIIADELVDTEFGTGCVKVTPAHDPNDFEMGKRHNLPFINILNKDGTLNENAGKFQGQDRFEARKNVIKELETLGSLVKIEDYKHTVPYSDRGKVPVEPLISTQWFVKISSLAERALNFLDQQDSPVFVPERWTKVYRDWLARLRDWCISRQLWWGHQIPAWYAVSETGGEITDETPFVVASSEEEATEKATSQFGEDVKLERDNDVLDTWFSSGLWPFSTMGWPEETADLKTYYPTTTLVTGFDIIFFWVARMTMMAGHFTGQMPFKTVYIHGLVRDENKKKMSKSANNGIDPLILIDKYGTDALRYTLIREVVGAGQDIRLEYDRKTDESLSVEASRNFANKLWNASRFVMMNLDGKTPQQLGSPFTKGWVGLELSDRWILSRFHQLTLQNSEYLNNYGMGEAAKGIYEFIWGDFCDWYIELVKSRLREEETSPSRLLAQQTLAYILEGSLKLLHPFMPHITEELWQMLHGRSFSNEQLSSSASNDDNDNSSLPQPTEFLALQAYPEIPEISEFIQPTPAETEPSETILESPLEKEQESSTTQSLITTPSPSEVSQSPLETEASSISNQDTTEQKPVSNQYLTQAQKIGELAARFLSELPDSVSKFFEQNQKALSVVVFLLGAIIIVKVVLAAIGAINNIPVLPDVFKLIGFGYTIWFGSRHLLLAKNRQKLAASTRLLKEQTLGKIDYTQPVEPTPEPQLTSIEPVVPTPEPETEPQLTSIEPVVPTPEPELTNNESLEQSQPEVKKIPIDPELEQQFELLIGTIRTIRNLRAEADIKPGVKVEAILETSSSEEHQILEAGKSYIQDLAKVETLTITPALETQPQTTMVGVVGTVQVLIPLAGVVDVDALCAKLEKNLGKVEGEIKALSGRLSNENFVSKAPEAVVQEAKEKLTEAQKQAEILRDRLKRL
ncbi:MAG: valine--tRNA ligase [Symploca sp. SIO2B6]|nr:valine--tRNA ligase [Symploca sp. SIO2B6]